MAATLSPGFGVHTNENLRLRALRQCEGALLSAIRDAAARLEDIVVTSMKRAPLRYRLARGLTLVSSRSRKRKGFGKPQFVASAPYTPPHSRRPMEGLRANIDHEVDRATLRARIGSNVIYDRALELGYSPRNLLPRPHYMPALRQLLGEFETILGRYRIMT